MRYIAACSCTSLSFRGRNGEIAESRTLLIHHLIIYRRRSPFIAHCITRCSHRHMHVLPMHLLCALCVLGACPVPYAARLLPSRYLCALPCCTATKVPRLYRAPCSQPASCSRSSFLQSAKSRYFGQSTSTWYSTGVCFQLSQPHPSHPIHPFPRLHISQIFLLPAPINFPTKTSLSFSIVLYSPILVFLFWRFRFSSSSFLLLPPSYWCSSSPELRGLRLACPLPSPPILAHPTPIGNGFLKGTL